MSVYNEIWTGETIKAFRDGASNKGWLGRIKNYGAAVSKNNTIHFVDLGGDPSVLINNSNYPLVSSSRSDADKAIALDRYQTTPTKVSDDEARGISYDIMGATIEQHKASIEQSLVEKALHSLAPTQNAVKTPVLETTGANDGNGRNRLTMGDIIALKNKFDAMRVPTEGRVLVLTPDHVSDLLLADTTFANRYNNDTTGKIANLYGFEIYEYAACPHYTFASNKWSKAAVGASTGTAASVAFHLSRVMKADGELKAYIDEPSAEYQEWRFAVRKYFICLPLKEEALGAIVSGTAAS